MLTEHFLVAPRPVRQLAPHPSMPPHDVQSQLYWMKRCFEIGIQMGLVLASMKMMLAALRGLLKLFSRLWLRMLGTRPQHEKESRKDLRWHDRRQVILS